MNIIKRAIITGPTGSIGVALIKKLLENKIKIYAISRRGSSRLGNLPKHELLTIIECSLSDIYNLKNFINEKCDVFFHLGWDGTFGSSRNDLHIQNMNVKYTLDAVNIAKELGCHTFLGVGSQAEYGRVEGILRPDTAVNPENGYGMAKLCAGQMSRLQCNVFGIRHIWVRVLSVYGPCDGENTMIMSTINTLLKGAVPKFTKGEQMWDYLYSGDAAKALYLLAEKGKDGSIYCLGSGKARPLKEYIHSIRDVINPNLKLGIGLIPYDPKQVMYLCADTTNIINDIGYYPETLFEDGIRDTINYCILKKN